LQNFYNLGQDISVEAMLDFWEVFIDDQLVDGLLFSGEGIPSGNMKKLDFSYTVKYNQETDTISASYSM